MNIEEKLKRLEEKKKELLKKKKEADKKLEEKKIKEFIKAVTKEQILWIVSFCEKEEIKPEELYKYFVKFTDFLKKRIEENKEKYEKQYNTY